MEIKGDNSLAGLDSNRYRIDVHSTQPKAPSESKSMPKPGRDRVELSIHGGEIDRLDGLIPSHPDDRETKIEQVRDAIDSGTYNVKAERIADKIMGESPD